MVTSKKTLVTTVPEAAPPDFLPPPKRLPSIFTLVADLARGGARRLDNGRVAWLRRPRREPTGDTGAKPRTAWEATTRRRADRSMAACGCGVAELGRVYLCVPR